MAEPLRVLTVAPLEWTSGFEFALSAVALAVERGVACEYRIVGGGAHVDAVAFARHQLGLDDRVELVRPDGRGELHRHLVWADVVLDAAVAGGPPPIEADGLPLVTTRPPDGAGDRVVAVPRRDPEAMCEALLRLARLT